MAKASKVAPVAFIIRQGDVLCMRIPDVDTAELATKPLLANAEGILVAVGESSQHSHRVFGTGAKLFAFRDTANTARVLVVGRAGAELRVVGGGMGGVDRHEPISLPAGAFEVRIQRTWSSADEAKSLQVAD